MSEAQRFFGFCLLIISLVSLLNHSLRQKKVRTLYWSAEYELCVFTHKKKDKSSDKCETRETETFRNVTTS